ncbi:MAG TPA: iron ABC transporter permease [Tissierellia bacterium]|nr:iron ABC transporter permease [Tissierellia bacterium]
MKHHKNNLWILLSLFILCIVFFMLSIMMGAVDITFTEALEAFLKGENTPHLRILLHIRLPRTLVAMLVGSALALAGAILQGVMRNPLATPNIIGVSSGAGLSALTIMILFPSFFYLVPIGAFVGALLTTAMIYTLAWKRGIVPTRLILAGVAVNTVLGAGNNILLSTYPQRVGGVIHFLVGGLSGVGWKDVRMITPYILVSLFITLFFSQKMNILMLGDELATGLGLQVERVRRTLIVLSSLLAGSAVSAVGLLGFVGLIVPHMARLFVGNDHRWLFPTSIFLGSLTLMACDLIARMIFAPVEVPVGVIMSILGGPFFLFILRRQYRGHGHDRS